MKKYTVTIRAVYVREFEITAADNIEAEKLARAEFKPESDDLFSFDVFGLDPWQPENNDEDAAYEQHRQREIDDAA